MWINFHQFLADFIKTWIAVAQGKDTIFHRLFLWRCEIAGALILKINVKKYSNSRQVFGQYYLQFDLCPPKESFRTGRVSRIHLRGSLSINFSNEEYLPIPGKCDSVTTNYKLNEHSQLPLPKIK